MAHQCCSSPRPTSSSASTPGSRAASGPSRRRVATARQLALEPPAAVVHVGIAGAHGITPGGLVIGSESVYSDLSAEIPVVDRVEPDERLLAAVREALPDALVAPDRHERIRRRTSAHVERALRVEAMEGFAVLRACAQAGVPAVEIRAISNELAEGDRSRWRIGRALEALADALPRCSRRPLE